MGKNTIQDQDKEYDELYKNMIGRSFKKYIQEMLITDDERIANEFLKAADPELLERYYTPNASPFRIILTDENDDADDNFVM